MPPLALVGRPTRRIEDSRGGDHLRAVTTRVAAACSAIVEHFRSVTSEPMPLLASGRDGDVFEFGPGLVLRRPRDGRNIEHEARIIEHVRGLGFPAPKIHDVRANGTEIVMERIDGGSMLDVISRRPWTLASHARVLADLHRRLHALDAPEWLPQLADGGDRIVHLDLHPLNVLYSSRGPVLIDWANASRGRAETDLAQTWLIIAASDTSDQGLVARIGSPLQRYFASRVMREVGRASVVPFLRTVAEARAKDRNVRPGEVDAMFRIVEREEHRLGTTARR
jgi:tRNA A-37 threonylcarbamoyl transferase component Bud32